jgi:hypothetical protein
MLSALKTVKNAPLYLSDIFLSFFEIFKNLAGRHHQPKQEKEDSPYTRLIDSIHSIPSFIRWVDCTMYDRCRMTHYFTLFFYLQSTVQGFRPVEWVDSIGSSYRPPRVLVNLKV